MGMRIAVTSAIASAQPHPEERRSRISKGEAATYLPSSFETPAFALLRRAPQDEGEQT